MDEVVKIVNDIKQGNIKPIYFLMGEEPYYIDKITDFIEDNVLTEDEKGFNQMVLYGKDVSVDEVVSNAKRYPMMADRQVVIVKEAQDLSRHIEKTACPVWRVWLSGAKPPFGAAPCLYGNRNRPGEFLCSHLGL